MANVLLVHQWLHPRMQDPKPGLTCEKMWYALCTRTSPMILMTMAQVWNAVLACCRNTVAEEYPTTLVGYSNLQMLLLYGEQHHM